jgi:hypothetical protein
VPIFLLFVGLKDSPLALATLEVHLFGAIL